MNWLKRIDWKWTIGILLTCFFGIMPFFGSIRKWIVGIPVTRFFGIMPFVRSIWTRFKQTCNFLFHRNFIKRISELQSENDGLRLQLNSNISEDKRVLKEVMKILVTTSTINTTTQSWLLLQCDGKISNPHNCMINSLHNIFIAGNDNIFQQTIKGILDYLENTYEGVRFRGAYFVQYENHSYLRDLITDEFKTNPNQLICRFHSHPDRSNNYRPYFPIKDTFTASISYRNALKEINRVKEKASASFNVSHLFVPSTKRELKRLFTETYIGQINDGLSSIICIPIITVVNTKFTEGTKTNKSPRLHGVLCLDCDQEDYFTDEEVETLKGRLIHLTNQLAIGSLLEELIATHIGSRTAKVWQGQCKLIKKCNQSVVTARKKSLQHS
jgi:hypothetical protein